MRFQDITTARNARTTDHCWHPTDLALTLDSN